jgi:hypothetical protein
VNTLRFGADHSINRIAMRCTDHEDSGFIGAEGGDYLEFYQA